MSATVNPPGQPTSIVTDRLELVVATSDCLRAELGEYSNLSGILGAVIPAGWPPELYDRDAVEFTLARLEASPRDANWWMRYIVVCETNTVAGIAAFKGPPAADGSVEIGYALLREFQKQGYATEAVRGLVATAFADSRITVVRAQTLPGLVASIRVLDRVGFAFVGTGVEGGMGTVQYELTRAAYRIG